MCSKNAANHFLLFVNVMPHYAPGLKLQPRLHQALHKTPRVDGTPQAYNNDTMLFHRAEQTDCLQRSNDAATVNRIQSKSHPKQQCHCEMTSTT